MYPQLIHFSLLLLPSLSSKPLTSFTKIIGNCLLTSLPASTPIYLHNIINTADKVVIKTLLDYMTPVFKTLQWPPKSLRAKAEVYNGSQDSNSSTLAALASLILKHAHAWPCHRTFVFTGPSTCKILPKTSVRLATLPLLSAFPNIPFSLSVLAHCKVI